MNCLNHPETPAAAYCRTCGRPLCVNCERPAQGSIFCEEHVPIQQAVQAPARVAPPVQVAGNSPGLAFVLGLIPGVGAIYNGQYAKGVVHVVIMGLLISILSSGAARGVEPLFGLLLALFIIYMPFEAYHTARKRQFGEYVDEFSSIFPMRAVGNGFPAGPVLLIALGVLFLLNTMGVLRFERIVRFWPVILIGLGVYMLYCRLQSSAPAAGSGEVRDEQP